MVLQNSVSSRRFWYTTASRSQEKFTTLQSKLLSIRSSTFVKFIQQISLSVVRNTKHQYTNLATPFSTNTFLEPSKLFVLNSNLSVDRLKNLSLIIYTHVGKCNADNCGHQRRERSGSRTVHLLSRAHDSSRVLRQGYKVILVCLAPFFPQQLMAIQCRTCYDSWWTCPIFPFVPHQDQYDRICTRSIRTWRWVCL